jgi:hypothetical protein
LADRRVNSERASTKQFNRLTMLFTPLWRWYHIFAEHSLRDLSIHSLVYDLSENLSWKTGIEITFLHTAHHDIYSPKQTCQFPFSNCQVFLRISGLCLLVTQPCSCVLLYTRSIPIVQFRNGNSRKIRFGNSHYLVTLASFLWSCSTFCHFRAIDMSPKWLLFAITTKRAKSHEWSNNSLLLTEFPLTFDHVAVGQSNHISIQCLHHKQTAVHQHLLPKVESLQQTINNQTTQVFSSDHNNEFEMMKDIGRQIWDSDRETVCHTLLIVLASAQCAVERIRWLLNSDQSTFLKFENINNIAIAIVTKRQILDISSEMSTFWMFDGICKTSNSLLTHSGNSEICVKKLSECPNFVSTHCQI